MGSAVPTRLEPPRWNLDSIFTAYGPRNTASYTSLRMLYALHLPKLSSELLNESAFYTTVRSWGTRLCQVSFSKNGHSLYRACGIFHWTDTPWGFLVATSFLLFTYYGFSGTLWSIIHTITLISLNAFRKVQFGLLERKRVRLCQFIHCPHGGEVSGEGCWLPGALCWRAWKEPQRSAGEGCFSSF